MINVPDLRIECIICGETFLATSRNKKYCSPYCRVVGAKRKRKEWEQNNGYQARQRQRMREQRKADQSALQNRRQIQQTRLLEDSKKADAARKKKHIVDIRNRAHKGDMHALQEIALENSNALEYWRLYKEAIIKSEEEFHYRGRHLVGGIEVHEENFEYLVVEQIENKKRL